MYKIVLILFTLCLFACNSQNDDKTLVVAMDLSNPPFEMEDRDGFPEGKTVDYAEKLADYLNLELKIVSIERDNMIESVTSGKVDIIMSSFVITDERKGKVDFSNPYYETIPSILLSKESPYASFSEVVEGEITMAVKSGSWEAKFMEEYFQRFNLVVCNSLYECAEAVVNNKADAMLSNRKSIEECAYRYSETTEIMKDTFPEVTTEWGIALIKNNPDFKNKINKFIDKNPFVAEQETK